MKDMGVLFSDTCSVTNLNTIQIVEHDNNGTNNMLKSIKDQVKRIRFNLTSLSNQSIGKSVLTIVLFLDVFVLISIFQGLSDHTSQLESPYEYIPQHCTDIVIDNDWNESNRLIRTARIADRHSGSYVYINEGDRLKDVHPVCAPISKLLLSIENDKALSRSLSTFLRVREKISNAKSELERTKGAYDTSLLEIIAEQSSSNDSNTSLKKHVSELTRKLTTLADDEAASVSFILKNESITQLFNVIEGSAKKNRDVLLEDLRHLNFWYPVKRLGMEMLFLLPLIIIFFLWNSKSITASRPYQSLVSSHLLVVVFIPVVFKIIELVYDILPKKLLKQVVELLESLNLIAVWHYVMMGAAIVAALALIYVMQKKIFSQEKITQKRIIKGECQSCGVHLPSGSNACSMCGFKQFKPCSHCHKDTYVYGKYCRECGISE
jgi:ABC-type multidrug transport system fused ATPase/permease subunit